mmetsp:Transcript_10399/g.15702  ORF Transcript_10399/g.15702 Transcript_10399/m.15702 type:complete len:273 (-) Transcript_10399:2569-3387(-)
MAPAINIKDQELRLTVWIPYEQIGAVIGKSGKIVTKIQNETKCNVVIDYSEKSAWTPVHIKGNIDNVFNAGKLVSECVDEIDEESCVLEFLLDEKQKKMIVSENEICHGAKRISATHHVRIYISLLQNESEEANTLEGTLAKIKISYLALLDLANATIKKTETKKKTKNIRNEEEKPHRHSIEFTVLVPKSKLRLFTTYRYPKRPPVHRQIANHTKTIIIKLNQSQRSSQKNNKDSTESKEEVPSSAPPNNPDDERVIGENDHLEEEEEEES